MLIGTLRPLARRSQLASITRDSSSITLVSAKRLLGLPPGAFSVRDVKLAYRKQALILHPDTSNKSKTTGRGGDTGAFRELTECYELALNAATEHDDRQKSASSRRQNTSTSSFKGGGSGGAGARGQWSEVQWMNAAESTFEKLQRAQAYDEGVREQLTQEAEARQAAAEKKRASRNPDSTDGTASNHTQEVRWTEKLRGGWLLEGWESFRSNTDTGWQSIRTLRIRVTEPTTSETTSESPPPSSSSAEGVTEEWVGRDGSPRRRTLVQLPPRFDLARKTFGQEPFVSFSERIAAEKEFGAAAVSLKRGIGVLSYIPGLRSFFSR